MSHTRHHGRGRAKPPRFPNGSPPKYRRALNERYRARVNHAVRIGDFDSIGPPRRDAGWYW